MAPYPEAVFATLLMNDAYLPGAMVLGHSLKDKGAKAKLVVLVTMESLSTEAITELKTVYDEIIPINRVNNRTPANLYLMDRPDLISSFTKIELWKQTRYSQIVYIDADVVAIRAPNELLNLDTEFAASPDIGWPDCFNSGVMVLKPNMGDYYSLLALAQRGISFDGADQGLFNMHFRDWERLSFTYNCTPNASYQYIPAYRHFQSAINLIHFIGKDKPWTLGREGKHSTGVYGELQARWWATYDKHYRTPKTTYPTAEAFMAAKTVPKYVFGEPMLIQTPEMVEPVPVSEEPMGDKPEPVHEQDFTPTPTVEQRKFSAPQSDWDPARAPPPTNARPEAASFPNQEYTMSSDTKLFTPPSSYPEPPKDMYYQMPEKTKTPKPTPIFPWEAHARKATRVFPSEKPPSPPTQPQPTPIAKQEDSPPFSEEGRATPDMAADWQKYDRGNAWDDMPEIDRYVQAFAQHRRGPVQVLHQTPAGSKEADSVLSPPLEGPRRPSMKLTDFPTEIERPSLPVTPAPRRRPSFWGEERDELGELPAAEGVPKQEEWNPVEKLEELQRRQSEVLGQVQQLQPKDIPRREMPGSVSAEAAAEADDNRSQTTAPKPTFAEATFSNQPSNTSGPSSAHDVAPEVSTTA